ncbi:hypothetical protein D9613_004157 [Agrocybe pediades]|uniref:Fork-head domain-containing protein n=1 Tax=Agrocybe pediades TaxID=84607 RepID=A0A8H4QIA7_9AGAR|nr:hypothetical protein D9613_004157 [Agrocybe pediades]
MSNLAAEGSSSNTDPRFAFRERPPSGDSSEDVDMNGDDPEYSDDAMQASSSRQPPRTEKTEKKPPGKKNKIVLAKDHVPHDNCPDSLTCLPDTDERPDLSLPIILRCCILGSANKSMTIREIYNAMETKFPYYKGGGSTWKQAVRHHLALNRQFVRQKGSADNKEPGHWSVDLLATPDTTRGKGRKNTKKDRQDKGPK